MNLAQYLSSPAPSGASLMHLYDMPMKHHLHPANTALQTVRKVIEKIGLDEELPTHSLRQKQVLALVEQRGHISHADIAITLGISIQNARSVVRVMLFRERLVRDKGTNPSTFSLAVKP